jgi:hypothetical protein
VTNVIQQGRDHVPGQKKVAIEFSFFFEELRPSQVFPRENERDDSHRVSERESRPGTKSMGAFHSSKAYPLQGSGVETLNV